MTEHHRVGLIVPSSNTTIETEVPQMLARAAAAGEASFSVHSSRVRMQNVTADELTQMVHDSDRCAVELADAHVDVIAYACLVAIMSQGSGYHETAEQRLEGVVAAEGVPVPVRSSAGALVRSIHALGARRVAIVTPYLKPLTERVVQYLEDAGIGVTDAISLEVSKNVEVARLDPMQLPSIAERLDLRDADAVVLSCCVQMPSLPALAVAEQRLDLPVLSAAMATVFELLGALGVEPVVPEAGHLLSGAVSAAAEVAR